MEAYTGYETCDTDYHPVQTSPELTISTDGASLFSSLPLAEAFATGREENSSGGSQPGNRLPDNRFLIGEDRDGGIALRPRMARIIYSMRTPARLPLPFWMHGKYSTLIFKVEFELQWHANHPLGFQGPYT